MLRVRNSSVSLGCHTHFSGCVQSPRVLNNFLVACAVALSRTTSRKSSSHAIAGMGEIPAIVTLAAHMSDVLGGTQRRPCEPPRGQGETDGGRLQNTNTSHLDNPKCCDDGETGK